MKTIIYAILFLALPISMAGKDSTAIKADNPLTAQTAKPDVRKDSPAPSIVKHDTVYVAVKEMPEDNSSLWISIVTVFLTFTAIGTTIWSARKSFKFSSDTLEEMKEQRLAAYKPEIIIPDIRLIGELNLNGYYKNFLYRDYKDPKVILKDAIFNIVNIGTAAAKKVTFTVSMDKKQFINIWQILESNNIDTEISFYDKRKGKLPINLISSSNDVTILYKQFGYKFNIKSYYSYLLPIEGNSDIINSTKLYLPECYTYLYTLFNLYMPRPNFETFPNLKIKFNFYDLINIPHECEYEFQPRFLTDYNSISQYSLYFALESRNTIS